MGRGAHNGGRDVAASPRKPLPAAVAHKPFQPALLLTWAGPRSLRLRLLAAIPQSLCLLVFVQLCSNSVGENWSKLKWITFIGLLWSGSLHASTRCGRDQRTGTNNGDWWGCFFEQRQLKGVWKQITDQHSHSLGKGMVLKVCDTCKTTWGKQVERDNSLFLRRQKFKVPYKVIKHWV